MRKPWPTRGCSARNKQTNKQTVTLVLNKLLLLLLFCCYYCPISIAVPSKMQNCGRLIGGITVSNPAEDMDICLFCLLCTV